MYSYQFERLLVAIVCPFTAAYVYVVAELGDFHAEEHGDGYLSDFVFLPLQSSQFNKEVAELHRKNKSVHAALTRLVHEHATTTCKFFCINVHLNGLSNVFKS